MALVTSAQDVCHQLFNQLRLSNLNYLVSETPYSAQIVLRKRFVKEATGPAWAQNPTMSQISPEIQEINENLQTQNYKLESNLETSHQTISILEEKLSKIEASALKCFKEKSDETRLIYYYVTAN